MVWKIVALTQKYELKPEKTNYLSCCARLPPTLIVVQPLSAACPKSESNPDFIWQWQRHKDGITVCWFSISPSICSSRGDVKWAGGLTTCRTLLSTMLLWGSRTRLLSVILKKIKGRKLDNLWAAGIYWKSYISLTRLEAIVHVCIIRSLTYYFLFDTEYIIQLWLTTMSKYTVCQNI